jgi:hypothetical protein
MKNPAKCRFWRWLAINLCFLGIFFLLLLLLLPTLINLKVIKAKIAQELRTRYKIEIQIGEIQLKILPKLRLLLQEVTLNQDHLFKLSIPYVTISPSLSSLMFFKLKGDLSFTQPQLIIWENQTKEIEPFVLPDWESLQKKLFSLSFVNKLHLTEGRFIFFQGKTPLFSVSSLNLDASLQKEQFLLTASFSPSFAQNFFLKIRAHPTGGIEGEIKGKGISLHYMTFLPQFWHRIEAKGDLHLTFHYVPKEEVNIGFNFIFPCLRLKTSSEAQRILTFKCGIIQGTTLRQHDRWDIKLTKIDLKTPHIYGQASFFYQKGKGVGYTLQARDLNIEEIRKYALTLFPEHKTVKKIFDIVKAGKIASFTLSQRAKGIAGLKKGKTIKIDAMADGAEIDIPGTHLLLQQAKGMVWVREGVLYGKDISGKIEGAQLQNGQMAICLKSKPGTLEVKTTLIASLKTAMAFLKHFVKTESVQRELDKIKQVEGKVKATLHLYGTYHKIKVALNGTIERAKVNYLRLPYLALLERVNFTYKPGKIRWQELKGSLGHTIVNRADGEVDFSTKDIKVKVSHLFVRLQADEIEPWLNKQRSVQKVWRKFQIKQGIVEIKNGRLQLNLSKNSYKAHLPFSVQKIRLFFSFLPEELWLERGEGVFSSNLIEFYDAIGHSQSGNSFILSGRIEFPFTAQRQVTLWGRGDIKSEVLRDWIYRLAKLPEQFKVKLPVRVNKFKIEYTSNKYVHFQGDILNTDQIKLSLNLTYKPSHFSLQRLFIIDNKRTCFLSLNYYPRLPQVSFSFKGELYFSTLESLLVRNEYGKFRLKGTLKGTIDLSHLAKSRLFGNLLVKALNNLRPGLELKKVAFRAKNKTIVVDALSLVYKDSSLSGKGQITFGPKTLLVNGDIYSPFIDGQKIYALFKTKKGPARLFNVKGWLNITNEFFKYKSVLLKGTKASLRLEKSQNVNIQIKQTHYCNIEIKGKLVLREGNIYVKADLIALNQDLNQLLNCMVKKDIFHGQYSLKANFTTEGRKNLLKEASQGALVFYSTNGRIYKFTLLAKIFSLLNVIEVFKGHLPDLSKEGFPYDKFEIAATLHNGILKIESALIDSPAMKIVGQGKIDISDFTTDLTILVAPLRTIDILMSKIPVVGKVLTGRSQTFISVPIEVKGPIEDPEVKILPATAIAKGIFDLMKRIIKLPIEIFAPETPH